MGISLAFHIVFAAAGVALPALMVLADVQHRRTRDPEYLLLSKQLAKGTSILFAVGAVSGTVLSFELGLLWPRFMGRFGESIGLPFALEGFAFFTEAIFLGIYLYGRGKVSPGLHLLSGVAVAVSGAASALFVTLVSAFMNGPGGTDPIAAMASPSWPYQVVHVLLSCYQATAWAMVAISGFILLRDHTRTLHRKALALALPIACLTALVQPLSGDRSAKHLAVAQPLKLAAAEAHLRTGAARCAAHRRRSRSRHGRVPRRDSDPGRPVVPRVRRLRRDGHRAGGVPARRLAAGRARAHRVPGDGRRGQRDGAGGDSGDRRGGAPAPMARRTALVAGVRRARPARLRQPRGRLAGHRVGAAAVDRPRADAHGGGGHGLSLQGGAVLVVHDRLPVPGCRRRLPAGAPDRPRRQTRTKRRGPRMAPDLWLAGTIGVGLPSTSCSAARTSAAASGICWRAARARRRNGARSRPRSAPCGRRTTSG